MPTHEKSFQICNRLSKQEYTKNILYRHKNSVNGKYILTDNI